ncbi:hypothetical protein BU26DRAFT_114831 [Trematosphaeria pertusa]|uniref:Uncharacterized protein n=1 Tax=Trematosphaeria pertusa TaxID=390896 RepID=A0A6A6HYG5_9PLEO|nr:uncharacterized protein BU26DRAFT_114831 [Trematosphaeria pertusa]KAF2243274.1 hypothetical protein BU26DRAFT_114831 [Trematosphaeria pertusa]
MAREPFDWEQRALGYYNRVHDWLTNTRIEYWFTDPYGQFVTICSVLILACLVSAFSLGLMRDVKHLWTRITSKKPHAIVEDIAQTEMADSTTPFQTPFQPAPSTPHPHHFSSPSAPATTNLDVSTIHVHQHRTGRVSTPGYQTPFADAFANRDFSVLQKYAPETYAVLQEKGLLNKDGTPTKKLQENKKFHWGKVKDENEHEAERAKVTVEELVMDEEKRVRMRKAALDRMKHEVDAE